MNREPLQPRTLLHQILGFAGTGLLATLLQYVILLAGVEVFGARPVVASGAGFGVSAVCNYLLNYRLTFRSSKPHAEAALRFAIVATVGLLLNMALMAVLAEYFGIAYMVSQVITTCLVLVWNFCGNAFWSFAARKPMP